MKMTLIGLAFASVLGIGSAQALPLAAAPAGTGLDVTEVAQGCGPGMMRGPRGYCRPGWGHRRFYGPPRFAGPRCVIRRTPWATRRVCRW